jgi:hypothetical protein
VDHHQQWLAPSPQPEPSRLESDTDSDAAGMSKRTFAGAGIDRWASGRQALRAADPRMAELIDADPGLDPDALFDDWPNDLWGALVLQVIGQQLSRAAAAAIQGRLEALHGDQLPTPAQLLDTDAETLRRTGLSRAKAVYLHDLAARLEDGGSTSSGRGHSTTTKPGTSSPKSKVSAGSPPTGCSCWRCAGPTSGPPPTWPCAAQSNESGRWIPPRQSRKSTPSASASGRGGRLQPPTSTEP